MFSTGVQVKQWLPYLQYRNSSHTNTLYYSYQCIPINYWDNKSVYFLSLPHIFMPQYMTNILPGLSWWWVLDLLLIRWQSHVDFRWKSMKLEEVYFAMFSSGVQVKQWPIDKFSDGFIPMPANTLIHICIWIRYSHWELPDWEHQICP